jgi:hypothetical protein
MAKRARGSTSRPGQRAPIQRTTPRPPSADIDLTETALAAYGSESSLTDADIARAAELEAQIVAQEKVAEASTTTARARSFTPPPRSSGTLAQAASEEYAYVARDVRRIALIGGSLIGLLFAAWAVISFTGLGIFQ